MARNFTITTPAETVRVGADGKAEMVFTVTNTGGTPHRAMGRVVPLGNTDPTWLSVPGEREREFPVGAVQQFSVAATVPAGTPSGRYPWRFDVVSALKSGEDITLGPAVAFEVADATTVEKKRIPWWVWVALAVAALVIGLVVFLVMRGPDLVQVPSVVGSDRAEAEKAITDAELVPKVIRPTKRRAGDPGTVVAQDPESPKEVEKGSTVTLEVQLVEVRRVVGWPRAAAVEALTKDGLVPKVIAPRMKTVAAPGFVIAQDPEAPKEVEKGSTVTLEVRPRRPLDVDSVRPPFGGGVNTRKP